MPALPPDEDLLHRLRDDPPPPEQLAVRERGLHALHELASPRRRQPTQPRERARDLRGRMRIGDARRQPARPDGARDLDEARGHEGADVTAIALRRPQPLLPLRIANPGRIAAARVEQLEGIRDQRRHRRRGPVLVGRRWLPQRGHGHERRGVKRADHGGDARSLVHGERRDRLAHMRLAREIELRDPIATGRIEPERPAVQQRSAAHALRVSERTGGLDEVLPRIIVGAAQALGDPEHVATALPRRASRARKIDRDHRDRVGTRPPDRDELGREVRERVEPEVISALRDRGDRERGLGVGMPEPRDPRPEIRRQLERDRGRRERVEERWQRDRARR